MNQRFFHTASASFLALVLSTAGAAAQSDGYVTNSNQRGVLPFGSYQLDAIDNVNLGSGAVNFNIPLWTRAGRGLDWSEQIHYSSKLWALETQYNNPAAPGSPTAFAWIRSAFAAAATGVPTGRLEYQEQFYTCTYNGQEFGARVRSNFTWEDASGASVRFPNRDYRDSSGYVCDVTPEYSLTVGRSDNGGMELDTSGDPYVIRFKDGSRLEIPFYGGAYTLKDSNGNYAGAGQDTVGRPTATVKDSGGTLRTFVRTYSTISATPSFPTSYSDDQLDYDDKNWRLAAVKKTWNASNQVSEETFA